MELLKLRHILRSETASDEQPEYAVAELVICITNEYLFAHAFWPAEYLCLFVQ